MSRYSLFFQFLLMSLLLHLDIPQIQAQDPIDQRLQPYIDILDTYGEEPEDFVIGKLTDHDLLIFDDAWHPAVEPFEFYQKLIKNPSFSNKITYIFVEAFPINKQKYIDAYLNAPQEDNKILYPLFQDDFSGEGWPLKTYFDLMETLYYINSGLPPEARIRVLAVNSPTYWSEISTHEDLELFRKTLVGNDYTMYKIILNAMDRFNSGQKGIFLTNTRHAYKGIKDTNGNFFWNCGTFFHQWHPGKTFSIRIHNMALFIQSEKRVNSDEVATTAGLEKILYKWIRMADGLWDSAFKANANAPVAIPLKDNVFGREVYIGNHMHKALPGQTMHDANDALIFLGPLESLHTSAIVSDIYTSEFKLELARRYRILYSDKQLSNLYQEQNVTNLKDLIEIVTLPKNRQLIPQAKSLDPINAWKEEN